MQQPRTPGTTPASQPGRTSGFSDEELAAALHAGGGASEARPVATLLARHWQSVFDYALICATSNKTASMLTTAAFSQLLENLSRNGAVGALRPHLLVTVRHIAKAWSGDQQVAGVLTGLMNPEGPGENRQLVSRSFHAMPMTAQVLLWHAEAEAEGISIPSGLLGIDPRVASDQLEHAREQFRQTCVRVHREYAPTGECRHYNRLLDISLRRGGALIPDIQVHLTECSYCRFAADQLRQSGGRLGVLLAEALLGGAAREYLDSRPGRRRKARAQGGPEGGPPRGRRRHSRGTGPRSLRGLALRGRRTAAVGLPSGALSVGAAAVSGLLAVALVTSLGEEDDNHAGPSVPSGAVTGTAPPATGTATPPPSSTVPAPSTTSAAHPVGPLTTRLRNVEAGLCLDIADAAPKTGSEVTLATCSSAAGQKWVYESDGRLRSGAVPDLCLDSHGLDGIVVLDVCTGRAAPDAVDVRYDLTIQGQVVPRWNDRLAVVPASPEPGSPVVVKIRDESPAQVWGTDSLPMGPQQQQSGTGQTSPYAEEVNVERGVSADGCATGDCASAPPVPSGAAPGAEGTAAPEVPEAARDGVPPDAVDADPRWARDTAPDTWAQEIRPPVPAFVGGGNLVGAPIGPSAGDDMVARVVRGQQDRGEEPAAR